MSHGTTHSYSRGFLILRGLLLMNSETEMNRRLNVLVAEDEVLIRKFITTVLQRNGCSISGETAYGEDAVRLTREHKPDLAIMDISLKGTMDGFEAACRIQENGFVPIIFISAYSFRDKLLAESHPWLIGILSKPMDDFQLLEMLNAAPAASHNR